MRGSLEGKTSDIGLRDFLFYLVPGAMVLASVLLFAGTEPAQLQKWSGLGGSFAAVIVAYVLGQMVYPLSYIPRKLFFTKGRSLSKFDELSIKTIRAIEEYQSVFVSISFRDRSFARFTLAMVFPTILLGIALFWTLRLQHFPLAMLVVALGFAVAAGFIFRAKHYDTRYRRVLSAISGDAGQLKNGDA